MKILRLILLSFLSLVSLQALAQRMPVPIVNHQNVAIESPSGNPRSLEEVKQAILTASLRRPWSFSAPEAGTLIATLNVRGKHTVVTEIRYAPDKYSLIYRSSDNMKFAPAAADAPAANAGPGVIHPFYNTWVQELREDLRKQFLKS